MRSASALLDFDPYLAFPEGVDLTPLRLTLAALARLAGGKPGRRRVVDVGLARLRRGTVLVLYLRRRDQLANGVARRAALRCSRPFRLLWLGGRPPRGRRIGGDPGLRGGADADSAGGRTGGAPARRRPPAGSCQAFALLLWPGCLLAVLVVDAALVACIATRARRAEAVALAPAASPTCSRCWRCPSPGATVGALGSFSPVVLSRFQPTLLAAGAACSACWGELPRVRLARSRGRAGGSPWAAPCWPGPAAPGLVSGYDA
jgi:hypothetical protein